MLDPTSILDALRSATKHGGTAALARKVTEIWREHVVNGVAHVRKQVREVQPDSGWAPGEDELAWEPTVAELGCAPVGRIGVMAHVFYPDLAGELAAQLAHVPWPFTLLVSVTSEEARGDVEPTLRQVRAARTLVRVVPNRGRDIAPLLVDFRDELRRLEYVCHVHTKKSLRTGANQIGWRQHLWGALLGSEERVRAIFAQFRADPTVGIVYPEPPVEMPWWGHTWLANRTHADRLLPRLGLEVRDGEYLDFPAGSMFWARVDALRPLLDLGLSLEDFPPEEGQTDGTLQHTLERCFVLAAARAGFSSRVLPGPGGPHRFVSRNHKNLHHYLAAPVRDRILAAAIRSPVVTFDVFDTLLVRPFGAPESVLRLVDDRAAREHGFIGFLARRKAAEAQARQERAPRDVTITDVYGALARREALAREQAAALLALELAAEADALRPRPEVVAAAAALRAAGKRVVLVSDTYLERAHVEALLRREGVDCWDALYLSSEAGVRKDTGALWDHVLREEGLAPGSFVHVGDNERSDVQIPVDRRLCVPVHVMRPLALFEQLPEGAAFLAARRRSPWRDDLVTGLVANELALALDADPSVRAAGRLLGDPGRFGFCVLGPVVLHFLAWLARHTIEDGVPALEFLSREGFILKEAWDRFAAHPSLPSDLPPSRYLLASRRAAVLASVRTPEDAREILRSPFHGTLEQLLTVRLGIDDLGAVRRRLPRGALAARVRLPRDVDAVFAKLRPCADLVVSAAADEREAFLAYLGDRLAGGAALVDVGYSATIQRALTRLVARPQRGYYFATTRAARALLDAGGAVSACFGEDVDLPSREVVVHRYSLLLEAVLTSEDGQLLRFRRRGAAVEPEFAPPGRAQLAFAALSRVHAGIHRFVRAALDAAGRDLLERGLDPALAQAPLALAVEGRWRATGLDDVLFIEDHHYGNGEIPVLERLRRLVRDEAPGAAAGASKERR